MTNIQEIWKPIIGYEGIYEVSNLGRVKYTHNSRGSKRRKLSDGILTPTVKNNGYLSIMLYKNKKSKRFHVHRLVGISFLGDSNLQINHKDKNRQNNCLDNIEFVTNRENTNHKFIGVNKSSVYRGVRKNKNSFMARIQINGKRIYLGTFDNEKDASNAYEKALLSIPQM